MVFTEGCNVGCIYLMCAWIHPVIQMDFAAVAKPRSWDSWHWFLGHVNIGMIKLMKLWNLITGMDVDTAAPVMQSIACIQGCIQGKDHVEPFPKWAEDAAVEVDNLSISDVWGPANTEGPAWEWYFYSFTNAKSRCSITYFSHAQDGVLERFKEYAALVETQTGCHLMGMYEHPILQEVINAQWFGRRRWLDGTVYGATFNPMPVPVMALVFMAVRDLARN